MSILTSVQRDGQWVTETVDMQTVLNKAQEPKPVKQSNRIRPPTCGLLTRTVVETELAHFILPVRLRSSHNNDVAFVGVSIHTLTGPSLSVRLTSLRTTMSRFASYDRMDSFRMYCARRTSALGSEMPLFLAA